MRLKFGKTKDEKHRYKTHWRWWFAWYPVRFGGSFCRQGAWLEWVVRMLKEGEAKSDTRWTYLPPELFRPSDTGYSTWGLRWAEEPTPKSAITATHT